jgi:Leucine-rich repeat (LRR) protein
MAARSIFLIAFLVLSSWNLSAQGEFTSLEEALKNPEKVRSLELSSLGLQTLPDELAQLRNLEYLSLQWNSFAEIPPVVFKLTSLRGLAIIGQDPMYLDMDAYDTVGWLSRIPPEIKLLQNLESLDLSTNYISAIPGELSELPKLEYLSLWGNSLYRPDSLKAVGKMPQLKYLDLGSNDLVKLPREFSGLTGLIEFRMVNRSAEGAYVGEGLEKFPDVLLTLTQLESLTLDGNLLKKIPADIGKLTQLKYLSLEGNWFLKLPDEIGKLTELEYLDIEFEPVGYATTLSEKKFSFPKSFCNLKKLKELHYSSRKVSEEEKRRIEGCLVELKKDM